MEPGRIVYFTHTCTGHYIAAHYNGQYLFLSTDTFNRRDNFQATIESHINTGLNITEFNLPEIINYHITENDKTKQPIIEYRVGLLLQDKLTDKYYSIVIVYDREFRYEYYLLDLNTFELISLKKQLNETDYHKQFEYVQENYDTYDLYWYHLQLNIKGGIY